MNSTEFLEKLTNKEIRNGTIFDVIKDNQKIIQIGVIRSTVVNLEAKDMPKDLLIGDYIFQEVEGEE